MTKRTTFTSGRHIHNLLEKDTKSLVGVCSRCGPIKIVELTSRHRNGDKRKYYRCSVAVRESNNNNRAINAKSHGLTGSEVAEFVGNKVCAICLSDVALCVDHDHSTGKLRGVLCRDHNWAVGLFDDDPELLRRAADYLEGVLPVARSKKPTGDRYYGHDSHDVTL